MAARVGNMRRKRDNWQRPQDRKTARPQDRKTARPQDRKTARPQDRTNIIRSKLWVKHTPSFRSARGLPTIRWTRSVHSGGGVFLMLMKEKEMSHAPVC